MKKIFLLSLLSVFLLSAFSQTLQDNSEIITRISITKSADVEDEENFLQRGIWIFFWKYVTTYPDPDGNGFWVHCYGWGLKICAPKPADIAPYFNLRGVAPEMITHSCESIIQESDKLISNGMYAGSLTKKIALLDFQAGDRNSYLVFRIDWNHDPVRPYNGKAEITISKINNLGF